MKTRSRRLCGVMFLLMASSFPAVSAGEAAQPDWPMLGHDPARSGATAIRIRPPFARKWYRLFPDEGIMTGVQPVVAGGKVYVGTLRGVLHAIDVDSGKDAWAFRAGGAILHACAVANGRVFFGCADEVIYAVDCRSGRLAWSVRTGAAVWNAPLVHGGLVLVGGRDGLLWAIDADSGKTRWKGETGGPLLGSPALDAGTGRVYVGSEDMHVYAFGARDGRRLWRSRKLPGVSFRGYHPVVAPDGSVMITVTPAISLDSFNPVLHDMVKEIFGDFASWRHTKEENEKLRAANFELMNKPETYPAQLDYLRRRLTQQPAYQTFFVLDGTTGREKFVAPIVYGESMNGTAAPPVVTPEGRVIVKYRVLLRSRYQHYSPFLNFGYLDTATGHVTPIMDQSRTYGWHDSLLLVHDEQCQLAVAGRVLINAHQDNVNAMDLDTLEGYAEPFCRNIHEPQPGEAVGIWTRYLRGQPLPPGKEWLARGTAVYGGGSVLDVPVTVAGDSFYYLPTHEINAGVSLIAYKMQPDGNAGKRSEPPTERPSPQEWEKVQRLPWDWDTLETGRLSHVPKALPESVPGTRAEPLTERAKAVVAAIDDAALDRFIWEVAVPHQPIDDQTAELEEKLTESVRELISRQWRPLVFPAGKHPREAYRVFVEPTETLYTVARAYPYLDADLRQAVRQYVAAMASAGGPLAGRTGRRTYDPGSGAVRSLYDVPPNDLMRVVDDITRSEVARLYPLWLWAHVSGDWNKLETQWPRLRDLVSAEPNKPEEDCRNGHVAGLIAYCRIARHMRDETAKTQGVSAAREAMRGRLTYELAHSRGGLIAMVPTLRCIFSRWRHLTPEVGRLIATHAGDVHRQLMNVYVDYHRPTWWLAWNVELMVRNESPMSLPTMSAEIFAARAMILREPAEKLEGYLDLPWCEADLFHIQKLVMCLEARHALGFKDAHN